MSRAFSNAPATRKINYSLLPVGMDVETPPLPKRFNYTAGTVEVEFTDGSSCILHDVPPQAIFLSSNLSSSRQLKELAQAIQNKIYRIQKLN
jgi:hypothetical protein